MPWDDDDDDGFSFDDQVESDDDLEDETMFEDDPDMGESFDVLGGFLRAFVKRG